MTSKFKRKFEFELTEEVALDQVHSLLDYYEIDVEALPEKASDGIDAVLESLVRSVRLGRLEINTEDGIVCTQTLRNSETKIVYREIDGKSKTAMGKKMDNDNNGRIYAVMGALSDGEGIIHKLKGPDIGLVEALGAIFLLA